MKSNLRMPDGSGVVAIVGELVAAGMAQHVAVNEGNVNLAASPLGLAQIEEALR